MLKQREISVIVINRQAFIYVFHEEFYIHKIYLAKIFKCSYVHISLQNYAVLHP